MLEIELKARVDDHEAVLAKLAASMSFVGNIDKRDEYWSLPIVNASSPPPGFRLRLRIEPDKETVTFKEKTYSESIEVNKEVEFGILDAEAFRKFLDKMSAELLYRKQKNGTSWKDENNILAELVMVDGLGEYLEVERLCEEGVDLDIDEIKKDLIEVIKHCGLSARDIEARPYSQLLGMPRY